MDITALQRKVDELAVFQLSHYPKFIKTTMANVESLLNCHTHTGEWLDNYRTVRMLMRGTVSMPPQVADVGMTFNSDDVISKVTLAFLRSTPSSETFKAVANGASVNNETDTSLQRRATLEDQLAQLEHAKVRICEALGVSCDAQPKEQSNRGAAVPAAVPTAVPVAVPAAVSIWDIDFCEVMFDPAQMAMVEQEQE